MRLFVAITPPATVLDELEAQVAPLRPAWPGLRWTSQAAWHITLAFLGEVSEATAGALKPKLAAVADRKSRLTLSVAGAGAFPAPGRAQVLWTGIKPDGSLSGLAEAVTEAAGEAGAPPPGRRRSYEPHLTLARCRTPIDVRSLVAALDSYAGAQWIASEIQLIRSRLDAAPRYEAAGIWPLALSADR